MTFSCVLTSIIDLCSPMFFLLDNFTNLGPANNLLRKWKKRYPDPKLDPVPLWDDIITTRLVALKLTVTLFLLEAFNNHLFLPLLGG